MLMMDTEIVHKLEVELRRELANGSLSAEMRATCGEVLRALAELRAPSGPASIAPTPLRAIEGRDK